MRLFVAVDVPDGLREAIDRDVVEVLRPVLPEARWTRPEGRHLTLKFLGEVADERVDDVRAGLRAAVAGEAPFRAAFSEVGGFPNLRRPRVLWVGVGQGAEELARVAASVDRTLVDLGFEAEKRPFTGHLTLARFKVPKPVGDLPPVLAPEEDFEVSEITLFRSQLHPKGARYTVLERFPLHGRPPAEVRDRR